MSQRKGQIVVVGGGVVGLTTAIALLEAGFGVTVFTPALLLEKGLATPASYVAPAMFTPYAPPPGSPGAARFESWTRHAYQSLAAIAGRHPQSGVTMGVLREYCYGPSRLEGNDVWMGNLLATRPIAFNKRYRSGTESIRPHMDMNRYLPWLRTRIQDLGGRIIRRMVKSLDDARQAVIERTGSVDAVINCAGLGAAAFTTDPLLKPMRGRVLHVPNDLGLTYSLHDDALGPEGKVAYVFRFGDRLVLGGTFDAEGSPADIDDEAADEGILRRCKALLCYDGGIGERYRQLGQNILERRAADRPTRGVQGVFENLRVEREGDIIHNYGHGRMGATISWGTAAEVAALVQQG